MSNSVFTKRYGPREKYLFYDAGEGKTLDKLYIIYDVYEDTWFAEESEEVYSTDLEITGKEAKSAIKNLFDEGIR
jgi:hypothetical protein